MYFCRKINTFVYFAPTQICKYAFFYYYQTVGNDLNKTRWGGVILVQPRPCRVRAESVRRPSHVCVASVRVRIASVRVCHSWMKNAIIIRAIINLCEFVTNVWRAPPGSPHCTAGPGLPLPAPGRDRSLIVNTYLIDSFINSCLNEDF